MFISIIQRIYKREIAWSKKEQFIEYQVWNLLSYRLLSSLIYKVNYKSFISSIIIFLIIFIVLKIFTYAPDKTDAYVYRWDRMHPILKNCVVLGIIFIGFLINRLQSSTHRIHEIYEYHRVSFLMHVYRAIYLCIPSLYVTLRKPDNDTPRALLFSCYTHRKYFFFIRIWSRGHVTSIIIVYRCQDSLRQ